MDIITGFILKQVIRDRGSEFVKKFARAYARNKMDEASSEILEELEKVQAEGNTREEKVTWYIRDMLFRLWKAVVNNGHVADVIRDSHDSDVVEALLGNVIDSEANLETLLGLVKEATLNKAL